MTVESVTYISDLDDTYPAGGDSKSEGDNHIRNIKTGLSGTFPNFAGAAMTATEAELSKNAGVTPGTATASKTLVLGSSKDIDTLDITTPLLGGNAVNTANGFVKLDSSAQVPFANKAAFRGAKATKSSTQSLTSGIAAYVTFNGTDSYDTDSIHDSSTNNSRLTVPSGITKVRITGQIRFAANSTGTRYAGIEKNRVGQEAFSSGLATGSGVVHGINLDTGIINVSAADYFEISAYQDSGGGLNIDTTSWFSMEIIE